MKLRYWVIAATLLSASGLADPAQAQGRIPAGLTVSGRLDTTDNVRADDRTYYDDWFYDGRAGERITVTQTSTDFASWLSIGRVQSGVFIPDKSTGRTSGDQARIVYDLPADGRYVIRANLVDRGRTGAYTLRVDGPPRRRVLVAAEDDQLQMGELDASDPVLSDSAFYELWHYHGRAGERVTIGMAAPGFSSYLQLGRMNGDTFNYLAGSTTRTVNGQQVTTLNVTLSEAGEYGIRASSHGRRVGVYWLTIKSTGGAATTTPARPTATTVPSSSGSAATISSGSTVRGSLQPGDRQSTNGVYQDAYTFTGSKGDLIYVDMIASEFDPYLDLYRGSAAVASDDDGGDGLNARVQHMLSEDGTYTIYARSRRPNQTGSYTLSFRSVAAQTGARPASTTATGTAATIAAAQTTSPGRRQGAVGAGPIGPYTVGLNQSVTGNLSFIDPELDEGIHYDTWKFSGRAGQRIRITLEASGFTPLLIFGLNDESGEVVTSREDVAEDDDATIDFNIMVSGEYAILVTSHPQSTPFGGYTLTVRTR